jgi:hypothetical protein
MNDLRLVTFCGLCCDLRAQRCDVPRQAAALRESLAKEGIEHRGSAIPGFSPF